MSIKVYSQNNISRFKKQKNEQKSSFSFGQSALTFLTNAKYKIVNLITQLVQPTEEIQHRIIYIQGKKYNNRKQARQCTKKILWFSYRDNFKIYDRYNSDVGWGCLPRVGQMALASALKQFLTTQRHYNKVNQQEINQSIIAAFSDNCQDYRFQKYSLNKIVDLAYNDFKHNIGQWFNFSKICYTLKKFQNKYPMKGTQNLQILLFDQCLYITSIFRLQRIPYCKCSKKLVVCDKCHIQKYQSPRNGSTTLVDHNGKLFTYKKLQNNFLPQYQPPTGNGYFNKQKSYQNNISYNNNTNIFNQKSMKQVMTIQKKRNIFMQQRFKRDICIFLITRITDKSNINILNYSIFTLLDLPMCMGIMSGFPGQAIYIVGRQGNKLIYLNPHYVQKNSNNQTYNYDSFFCSQYLLTTIDKLDPSMTLSFYLKNLKDVFILVQKISQVIKKFGNILSFYMTFDQDQKFNIYDYEEQRQDIQQSSFISHAGSFYGEQMFESIHSRR